MVNHPSKTLSIPLKTTSILKPEIGSAWRGPHQTTFEILKSLNQSAPSKPTKTPLKNYSNPSTPHSIPLNRNPLKNQ